MIHYVTPAPSECKLAPEVTAEQAAELQAIRMVLGT